MGIGHRNEEGWVYVVSRNWNFENLSQVVRSEWWVSDCNWWKVPLNQVWDASARSRKADWGAHECRDCELHNLRYYLPKTFILSITILETHKSKCAHGVFCLKLSPLQLLHLTFILKIKNIKVMIEKSKAIHFFLDLLFTSSEFVVNLKNLSV